MKWGSKITLKYWKQLNSIIQFFYAFISLSINALNQARQDLKTIYKLELLTRKLIIDNAILKNIEHTNKNNTLTRESRIYFICSCGNHYNKNFRNIIEFSGCFCKKCSYEKSEEKKKQTNLEKYSVEYASQSEIVKTKIKQTNLEKFGVENPNQSEIIREKVKKTNLEKYSVEIPFQSEIVREKSKQTNLEKFGVEHASQNLQIFEKIQKNSFLNKNF